MAAGGGPTVPHGTSKPRHLSLARPVALRQKHNLEAATMAQEENATDYYCFTSKCGTRKADFEAYINQLDNNAGSPIMNDVSPTQFYVTFLTAAQLEDVKRQPWFGVVSKVGSPLVDIDGEGWSPGVRVQDFSKETKNAERYGSKNAIAARRLDLHAKAFTHAASQQIADQPHDDHMSSTEQPQEPSREYYIFYSNYGTEMAIFEDYITRLDNNSGNAIMGPASPTQGYLTWLTDEQVADVKRQPWFSAMSVVGYPLLDVNDDGSIAPATREMKCLESNCEERSSI